MLKNKESELSLISLFGLLFGSVLFASAVVLNATENYSFNDTLVNISLINESVINQLVTENATLNQSINLTINDALANQTINITLPEKTIKNLTKIVELNKNKLNNETESYLKSIKDKKEAKDYIIKFRSSIDETNLVNVTLDKKIEKFKVIKIKGKAEDIEDLIEDNEIEFIELEQNIEVLSDNVPFNVKKVKADYVWNLSKGSGVKIAVLDTGIGEHDDLGIAGGVSFVDNNYFDSNGHGTAVAGVIAALLDDEGLAGVAPAVDLYSVKIMQGPTGELSNAISGIEWAINNSIDIVSMSFGFDYYSQIFKEVLEEAYSHNILLVAASGNNGNDNILYPAKYDTVIAVGATTIGDNLAYFSSYGFEQELVAPGVDINSTYLGNSYGVYSGTSLAAPHVAGVAALIKSYNQSLTNEQIRAKLRNDALDLGTAGKDDLFGYGLVQVNLISNNFTIINLSYFYEVFNITDFGLPTVTYTFWLNGIGTIDDVKFDLGYYLVNITYNASLKKSYIYNVSENGTIFILATNLVFDDFFSTDGGTTTDRIAWINDNITVKVTTNMGTVQVECFNVGPSRQFNSFDYCYADTQTNMNNCESDPDIDCAITTCQVVGTPGIGTQKEIISYNFAHSNTSYGRIYTDCSSPGSSQQSTSTDTYYVVDRKAARCINDSAYNISGWYGTNWIRIAEGSCALGYQCVNSQNFTTESGYINPCIAANLCPGKVQVITEDSNGNPLSSLLVSRDDVSNKTTDSIGVAEYNLSKNCGQSLQFTVYCSNSSGATVCGTKSTSLDFIGDYDSLMFDCTVCNGKSDLKVSLGGVNVSTDTNKITVNFTTENIATVSNINITIKAQDKTTGLISAENHSLVNINSGDKSKTTAISLNLNNADFVHVYVDASNPPKVNESKTNNYVAVPVITDKVKAYVSVDTGLSNIDQAIKDYLRLFVIPTSQNDADIKIAVSLLDKNQLVKDEKPSSRNKEWYVDGSSIYFNGASLGQLPYTGIVATEDCFFCTYDTVFAIGTDIDGVVAAVKRLVNARTLYLKNVNASIEPSVIEKTDTLGLSVFDLMHNPENRGYYRKNNANFANVVTKILTDNNFEVSIKTVKTYNDNTTLRLKNVNSDFSSNYQDAIVGNRTPIVFAGGLFSDLFRWEQDIGTFLIKPGLAKQLVQEGRNIWEIEFTGGPTIDSDCQPNGIYNCPNYNHIDLVDYYWPALIAGVEKYSGENKINYVGHSNGCRVAIDSLKNWSSSGKNNAGYYFDTNTGTYLPTDLASNPVDTFIGLGCPGALNGSSKYIDLSLENGVSAIQYFKSRLKSHLTTEEWGERLESPFAGFYDDQFKVSLNLLEFYNNIAISSNDNQPASGLSLNKFYLIAGTDSPFELGNSNGDDGLVPIEDAFAINKSVVYNQGEVKIMPIRHYKMIDDSQIGEYIKNKLNR